jgi:hypothetical protein
MKRHRFRPYRDNPGAGVGIRLGRDGGVIDIEVDGDAGHASLVELLDGEPMTLGWMSRRGPHHLFLYEFGFNSLATGKFLLAEFPGLEFRVGLDAQLQSACPPTVGLDGRPRRWNGHHRVAKLPEHALDLILASARRKWVPPLIAKDAPRPIASKPPTSYGASALRQECDALTRTAAGFRHEALKSAAMKIASLAKADAVDWHDARWQLGLAADKCGLPRPESQKLLDWAYQRTNPRTVHICIGGKGEPQNSNAMCTTSSPGESLARAKARIPVVDVPPDLAGNPRLEPLARALVALNEEAIRRGESTFYAPYRTIQQLTGQPTTTTQRHMGALSKLGFLSLVKPGIPGIGPTGKANTWRWHDPPRPGETIWKKATKRSRA